MDVNGKKVLRLIVKRGKKMNKKIIITSCLCILSTSVKSKSLIESLQQYCVPSNGNSCSEEIKASYNQKSGYCECNKVNKHYNISKRECEECVYGSFASLNWESCDPINCPDGYYAALIENGNCPNGYSLNQVANGNCGNGYSLKEYDISTKTFK